MTARTLGDVGEFALLAELLPTLARPDHVLLGPGDDSAVVHLDGDLAVSTDTLVENVHFRREWSQPDQVGRKAVAVNVTDIEAMGLHPVALVLGFSAPAALPADWVRDFFAGVGAECAKAGVALVGGDITGARDVTIAVTIFGETGDLRPVTRSGARPGDVVAVCGELGLAGAGLVALSRGFRSPRAAVERQRCPEPPYGQGLVANRAGAHAMIDVSDGLLGDLGHIAEASDVEIDLDTSAFDLPDALHAVAAATGQDPLTFVLTGGEDQALAATFPAGAVPAGWRTVGSVAAAGEPGARVLVDGAAWTAGSSWDHFHHD